MTPEEALARISSLRYELNEHNHNYYVLNNPTISDFDFDHKLKELETWNRNILSLTTPTVRPIVWEVI